MRHIEWKYRGKGERPLAESCDSTTLLLSDGIEQLRVVFNIYLATEPVITHTRSTPALLKSQEF